MLIEFGLRDLSAFLDPVTGLLPDISTAVKLDVVEFGNATDWLVFDYAKQTAHTAIRPWYSRFDLNRDGLVDGRDIAYMVGFYMMASTDPGWNADVARCDVNNDGIIDILDLVLLSANFT